MVAHSKVVLCVLFSGMGEVAGEKNTTTPTPIKVVTTTVPTTTTGECDDWNCLEWKFPKKGGQADWPQYINCTSSCKGQDGLGWYSVDEFPFEKRYISSPSIRVVKQSGPYDSEALFTKCLKEAKENTFEKFNGIEMRSYRKRDGTPEAKCYIKIFEYKEDKQEDVQKGWTGDSDIMLVKLPVQGTAFRWARWVEEEANKLCVTRSTLVEVSSQIECQLFCDRHSACEGISYKHKDATYKKDRCYLCWEDELSSSELGFGFYRKPGGSNKLVGKHRGNSETII